MIKTAIINLDSIGSACGYGEGATLQEAQAQAMDIALTHYNRSGYMPRLCDNAVLVRDGARMG